MNEKQNGSRRHYTAPEKVAILREHLLDQVPISQVCDKHGVNPTMFYRWQQEFFERGAMVFEAKPERVGPTPDQRMKTLQAKLTRKDEVIAELMEEHLKLKKSLGEI